MLFSADALRDCNVRPPDYVAVQGIGCARLLLELHKCLIPKLAAAQNSGIGHFAIQIAKTMGFRVIALSSGPTKEKLARELGAHEYIDGSKVDHAEALRAMGGAKVIMCTAPSPAAAQKLLSGLAIDGTLMLLMLELEPMSIPPGVCFPTLFFPSLGPHLNGFALGGQPCCYRSACRFGDGRSGTP